MVEAEQAKIDRQLQTRIAVVGVGIGVAGVTATALPYYMKPPDKPQEIQLRWNSSPHQITQAIGISLGMGFLLSVGPWVLLSIIGRMFRFTRKPKTIKADKPTQP